MYSYIQSTGRWVHNSNFRYGRIPQTVPRRYEYVHLSFRVNFILNPVFKRSSISVRTLPSVNSLTSATQPPPAIPMISRTMVLFWAKSTSPSYQTLYRHDHVQRRRRALHPIHARSHQKHGNITAHIYEYTLNFHNPLLKLKPPKTALCPCELFASKRKIKRRSTPIDGSSTLSDLSFNPTSASSSTSA